MSVYASLVLTTKIKKQILNLTTINQTLVKKIEELESQTKTMSKLLTDLTERLDYIGQKTKIHKPVEFT